MLQKVEVYSYAGYKVYTFAVAESVQSDYIVTDITGLAPVKSEFGLNPHINYSGSAVQSTRVGPRNILITLRYGVGPGQIERARQYLYRYLDPKSPVTLRFIYDDGNTYIIRAFIEDRDTTIFDKDPKLVLNFLCPDPYFYSPSTLTFSMKTGDTIADRFALGNAETGVYLVISGNPNASYYEISNGIDDPLIWFGKLATGQSLEVSTVMGNKYIKIRNSDGSQTSGLSGITDGTMNLTVGGVRNYFSVRSQSSAVPVSYTLSVLPKWVGL